MKIAILGSFWDTDDEKSKISNEWRLIGTSKEFERTCFNWGKKIAKLDHSVIVGSGILHTADIKISKK